MTAPQRILVTGGQGQVGLEIARAKVPPHWIVDRPGREQLDICSVDSVETYLNHGEWSAIINCAAWTAVDLAEDKVEETFLANCQGPANLAAAAKRRAIPILHISTDYVFDGRLDRPYVETDPVSPLGVYGASKRAGELAVASANSRSVILRTAWVLSAQRSNFLKTMLRIGRPGETLRVVADQRGCPTSAADIAEAIVVIVAAMVTRAETPTGIYNFVNSGEASWHELAQYIFSCAEAHGSDRPIVLPVSTEEYPTRATRPSNSRLNTSKIAADYGIMPRPWQEAVADIVDELLAIEKPKGSS